MTPDEIVEFARQMRDAGAVFVRLPEGLEIHLAPKVEPIVFDEPRYRPPPEPMDPMKDPATYGLPEGSPIPGFEKLRRRSEVVDDDDVNEGDE